MNAPDGAYLEGEASGMKVYFVTTEKERGPLTESKVQALTEFDQKVALIEADEIEIDEQFVMLFEMDLYAFGEAYSRAPDVDIDDLLEMAATRLRHHHWLVNEAGELERVVE